MDKTISNLCNSIINIIDISVETVWLFRQQYFFRGHGRLNLLTGKLQNILQTIVDTAGMEYLNGMGVAELLNAQEMDDEILIADIIEGQLLPSLERLVQELQQNVELGSYDFYSDNMQILEKKSSKALIAQINNASERPDCEYIPEYTASGHITIRVTENNRSYYICGNNNPYRDAIYFVQGNIEPDKYKYVILGAGMLFEAQALLTQRPDAELVVVEEDAFLLKIALTYQNLSELLSDDRISIECCGYDSFIAEMGLEDKCILIRKPAMRHIKNAGCRMAIERCFVKEMTIKEQAYVLEKEFRRNIRQNDIKSIDECAEQFKGKTVYLVAGGPSLNNSIDILKNREADSLILSVGTVVARLKKEGIWPDFAIITDVADNMYHQLNGNIDYEKTSLLYMISANAKAVASFAGEKYAIFQKGFNMAEDYAREHGFRLVNTGGSVSTTALDVCIGLGCRKVICLGLDLAYTGNRTHAEGTLGVVDVTQTQDLPTVKNVFGKMVPTSSSLSSFHKWIENRIADERRVEFVNVSDGAYIEGMKNVGTEAVR